jgi:Short C-terminal domain
MGMSSPHPAARARHRVLVACLFAAGVLVGFVACFAVWVNRQALNTDNWTKTSGEVLANRQVDAALSTYVVNQLFTSADVAGDVRSALPAEVQGLAGPATAGLRALAERVVPQLLATTQVQEAWRKANRTAHGELLHILNGGGRVLSTRSGEVTLDLHELVVQLGNQLGVEKQLANAQSKLQGASGEAARTTVKQKLGLTLPPTSGRLVIMRAKQLRSAQNIATAIRGLAIVLPLMALALFALAVWLSPPGRRRIGFRTTGWCFVGIGLLVVFARRIAGDQIVDNLVSIPANRPAAHAVWSIATGLLYDIATAMVLYGIVIVGAAWSAGSTRPAVLMRRMLAPLLREHPLGSYATAAGILLLIVLWGPTLATREVLPVLGFAVLLALGVRYLRRRTAEECPGAQMGDTLADLRRLLPDRWARGAGRRPPTAASTDGAIAPTPGDAGAADGSRIAAVERLAALHERGALTDEEFAAEKRIALSRR